MISKNITIGSLDIDPELGRVWLNCPNCILRISNINFKNIEEKFSTIDINGKDGYMISGDSLETEYFGEFLEKITSCVLPKISEMSCEESEKFVDKLFLIIKEEVEKCQS